MASSNQILIRNSCGTLTRKRVPKLDLVQDDDGDWVMPSLLHFEGWRYRSPRSGISREQFAATLYSVRNTLRKVNETLRYPNATVDLNELALRYKQACARFFEREFQEFKQKYP